MAIARAESIPFEAVGAVGVVAVIALLLIRIGRFFLLTLLAGILWGSVALIWGAYQVSYDDSWLSGYQQVNATIERVEERTVYSRLLLSQIQRRDGEVLSGRADIYFYGKERAVELLAGQVIQASVKLHPPRNKLNPGAFDYRGYCFDRHVALIGSGKNIQLVDHDITLVEQIRQRITSSLPKRDEAAVIRALLLADRSLVPVAVQDDFAAAGAAHLLAISGLHVGMVAGWAFMLIWWLLTRRERWIIHLPVRKIALTTGLLIAIIYAAIAGWPITAQRSVLMLAAAAVAWWLRSRASPLNTMLAALILILLVDPGAIESISLWLSFIAVTALLIGSGEETGDQRHALSNPLGWIRALLLVSVIATLATLPVIADIFGRVPTYSLIANLILVPLYSILALPLSIIGEVAAVIGLEDLAGWVFSMAASVISYGNILLAQLHTWPGGNLWVGDVPLWVGMLYAMGMTISVRFLIMKKYPSLLTFSALTLILYLIMALPEHYPESPELIVWDVGQGAASTLSMPDGGVMVFDLPGRFGSRFNGGTDVAAGLRRLGLVHVDLLVISHAQSDHAGGAARLLDQMRYVKELWLADVPANRLDRSISQVRERITASGGSVRWLKRGDSVRFSDVQVEVLWPPQGFEPDNGNNSSLVLSLSLSTGKRILLPGDIEKISETMIVEGSALNPGQLDHELTLVPHHGSRTSSSEAWIGMVKPEVGIVQTGAGNRYHFPNGDVVRRYRDQGAKWFDTKEGAVTVLFDHLSDRGFKIEQFRPKFEGKRDAALQWWQRAL
ncbi:MAG TPA: DNA internalization-related competence protein ComEC/Rec2 [Mariprofundaceae bacterium]|nr:DNA internalization-related competence protein ComEC/Rec2 [Mariprofundaceae bacterium]